jgi:hypothetical protein
MNSAWKANPKFEVENIVKILNEFKENEENFDISTLDAETLCETLNSKIGKEEKSSSRPK